MTRRSISHWPESKWKRLTVRASGCTAVSVVPKLVDVHASLGAGVMTGDVPGDVGRSGLGALLESHRSLDVGVSSDDGDCSIS